MFLLVFGSCFCLGFSLALALSFFLLFLILVLALVHVLVFVDVDVLVLVFPMICLVIFAVGVESGFAAGVIVLGDRTMLAAAVAPARYTAEIVCSV